MDCVWYHCLVVIIKPLSLSAQNGRYQGVARVRKFGSEIMIFARSDPLINLAETQYSYCWLVY